VRERCSIPNSSGRLSWCCKPGILPVEDPLVLGDDPYTYRSREKGIVMKAKIALISALLLLAGCSEEAKENMKQAAENVKAAAQNVGEAVSETTKEANKQWAEANKNRVESMPNEDTMMGEEVKGDTEKLKQQFAEAKDKVMEKVDSFNNDGETTRKN
jgi:mannitol-specific phosphotransferase system IIBC component